MKGGMCGMFEDNLFRKKLFPIKLTKNFIHIQMSGFGSAFKKIPQAFVYYHDNVLFLQWQSHSAVAFFQCVYHDLVALLKAPKKPVLCLIMFC